MYGSDSFNLIAHGSEEKVDGINKAFYKRYRFPWPPSFFPAYPRGLMSSFLSQDLGYWEKGRFPDRPRIWVAGCGTNQAIFTALRFPHAQVVGTDISTSSLELCRRNADQIGIGNLVLEEGSLNQVRYREEFDYILSTGVIHHNADPEATLRRIAGALKPDGVLELMVYNFYHRLQTTACQKAVRTFYDAGAAVNMELELRLVDKLIRHFPYQNLMGDFLRPFAQAHESEMADSLLQPIEHSYTVESLGELAARCGLEYLVHCINHFDTSRGSMDWNLVFGDLSLQEDYDRLPDERRWQIANLLLLNDSPMLWFYLQKKVSSFPRKTERQICGEFMETSFTRSAFPVRFYCLNDEDRYIAGEETIAYPLPAVPPDADAAALLEAAQPGTPMKELFRQLRLDSDHRHVNGARIRLTTSAFPYLCADGHLR